MSYTNGNQRGLPEILADLDQALREMDRIERFELRSLRLLTAANIGLMIWTSAATAWQVYRAATDGWEWWFLPIILIHAACFAVAVNGLAKIKPDRQLWADRQHDTRRQQVWVEVMVGMLDENGRLSPNQLPRPSHLKAVKD